MNGPLGEPADAARDPARAALQHHHGQLLHRLKSLASALADAVAAGDAVAGHEARTVLIEWGESDLIPHVLAEEEKLYAPAAGLPEGRLLVEALLAEHRALAGLLEELRGAGGVAAAVLGGAIERTFALHVEKEDRLLVPLLAGAPGLSLAGAVEGLESLVGEAHLHP
ncbi:hemerythrin domain-containing protein [Arthrobacter mobilis]|uniref:Hemerythrin domain-containing protein n=1 Tax=Arthrobacter mobilis TaxID=2724944 RepID=A0A7X6K5X6_9MICC|nr:hemerythrin domain-containing protein [Arthrobacter mobilis]NKX56245.1 hemerythrin domain-containing protein [Arthrobacter mobilis]